MYPIRKFKINEIFKNVNGSVYRVIEVKGNYCVVQSDSSTVKNYILVNSIRQVGDQCEWDHGEYYGDNKTAAISALHKK